MGDWASMAAAEASPVPLIFDAAAAAEAGFSVRDVVHGCAYGLEWVHTASGLPWWASIPACTLGMRLALLPISLRQAKLVRTLYMVYREAAELTDKQLGPLHPPPR